VPGTKSVKAVRIEDDFSVITSNTSYTRFFHASPGLMDVDLYVDNVKVETGRSYADNVFGTFYNEFVPGTAGNHQLQVRKSGTDSLIVQTNTTFFERNAYTIILKGLPPNYPSGVTASTLELVVLPATN